MSISRALIFTVLPLLWTTMAVAQEAPPNPPPDDPVLRHKAFCGDRYAHEVARLAYLEAKLEVTEKQRGAWYKWQQWQLDSADKEQVSCLAAAPRPAAASTALEKETEIEKALAIKLQSLQSSRPALEALYEALTPAQRTVFDRPLQGDHFAPPHGDPHDHPGPIPPSQ